MTDIRLNYEWENGTGVAAPELHATWARLEIWVGQECVTRVEDAASQSARRSIYCSLYPIAEWVAFNWWLLNAHVRPAGAVIPRRAMDVMNRPPWLKNHNVRAAGDGFLWPDLTIIPQGTTTRLAWARDRRGGHEAPIRYISEGTAICPTDSVRLALAEFVENILGRLEDQGVNGTPLAEEWLAITSADADEAEFCTAAARLGLDPYSIPEEMSDLLTTIGSKLEPELLSDFLDAVDPTGAGIRDGILWISQAAKLIRDLDGEPDPLVATLRTALGPAPIYDRPWNVGWDRAREVRKILGLDVVDPFEFNGLIAVAERSSDDHGIQGLGGETSSGSPALVTSRTMNVTAQRFAQARALWHFAAPQSNRRFLLTAAHADRQRVERAFAAELLAPARGVQEYIVDEHGLVYIDDLEAVADHFGVSPFVIRHQAENQLELQLADEVV